MNDNYLFNNTSLTDYTYKYDFDSLLKLNKKKVVKIYTSFKNDCEWKNKIFTGIIETSANDYIVLSDPSNGKWYIIKSSYIDYIESSEEIIYK